MATAIPLAPGIGDVVCIPVIHPVQITSTVQETVHKVYPGFPFKVIGVQGVVGIQGGTTVATDLDLTPYIGTQALVTTAIPAVNGSTAATGTSLIGTITATEAQRTSSDGTDYISVDYAVTGGSSPTMDGCGVLFYLTRVG